MPTPNGPGSLNITGRIGPAILPALAAALILAGCGKSADGDGEAVQRVDPAAYDSFFLWAGVRPPPLLERARTVYILAGEVRARDNSRFVPLRPQAPRADHAAIWLVLRVERLDWQPAVTEQMMRELARWEAAGARVEGIQIDFDSGTIHLDRYAGFLSELRAKIPARYKLSVTGLMDWSANGDPAALKQLGAVIDEIVVQTYQGRTTIAGYEGYLASLSRIGMPYRVALVEDGEWQAPEGLAADPNFKGYVVFLLPRGG